MPELACPICGNKMISKAFRGRRKGFRFDCYGSDGKPCRVTLYHTIGAASFQLSRSQRAKQILERATALEGKKVRR